MSSEPRSGPGCEYILHKHQSLLKWKVKSSAENKGQKGDGVFDRGGVSMEFAKRKQLTRKDEACPSHDENASEAGDHVTRARICG